MNTSQQEAIEQKRRLYQESVLIRLEMVILTSHVMGKQKQSSMVQCRTTVGVLFQVGNFHQRFVTQSNTQKSVVHFLSADCDYFQVCVISKRWCQMCMCMGKMRNILRIVYIGFLHTRGWSQWLRIRKRRLTTSSTFSCFQFMWMHLQCLWS